MKKCKPGFWALAAVLALACLAAAQDGPDVTFKFKKIAVPKTEQTSIYGINNSGAMVGYYMDKTGTIHGLLLLNGEVTNIDDPNGVCCTEPINVSSNGTIVGNYGTFIEGNQAIASFVYQNGQFSDVGPTGCLNSAAAGINDSGEIVGWCTDSSDVVHGYLQNSEGITFLDYPGANDFTLAWGINNAGLVTLQWIDSNGNYEGATYNSATQEYSGPINVPGAAQTYIHSINNENDIAFSWYDASGNSYGALQIGATGDFCTFSDPHGPDYTRPDGINDSVDIVGRWEKTGGKYERGFEATIKKGTCGDLQLMGKGSATTGEAGVTKSSQRIQSPRSQRSLSAN
ncbi:MAG: hypothetical protein WBQ72_17065 [Terriglobales bacterium]|jgi:hypothetical protein